MATYLVSGATGFVGRPLLQELERRGTDVVRLTRRAGEGTDLAAGEDFLEIDRAWTASFRPDCVIHLAARVHVMNERASDPLGAFRQVNVAATLRVAEAAARAGTPRFVYISSIKAAGEGDDGRPLQEIEIPRPLDPYGVSKREAEIALLELGRRTGMEIVILRPPLVYGPGVGANFLSLMRAVSRGWPLPLGCASAPRSLISVENFVSSIVVCATHASAAGEIFHVSDGEDVSVAALARLMGDALGIHVHLLPVPVLLLRAIGMVTGTKESVRRLVEPLRVDGGKLRTRLGWSPPQSLFDGLKQTAAWYRSASSRTSTPRS